MYPGLVLKVTQRLGLDGPGIKYVPCHHCGLLMRLSWTVPADPSQVPRSACKTRTIRLRGEWDHLVPLIQGGAHKSDNIVPSCAKCNVHKGGQTVAQWKGVKV